MIVSSAVHAMSQCKGENKRSLFKPLKWHKCIGSEKIDNGKYEGEYRYGKFDGHGTFFWSDDRKYIGKWEKGKKNGFGIYISSNEQYCITSSTSGLYGLFCIGSLGCSF